MVAILSSPSVLSFAFVNSQKVDLLGKGCGTWEFTNSQELWNPLVTKRSRSLNLYLIKCSKNPWLVHLLDLMCRHPWSWSSQWALLNLYLILLAQLGLLSFHLVKLV